MQLRSQVGTGMQQSFKAFSQLAGNCVHGWILSLVQIICVATKAAVITAKHFQGLAGINGEN